jgi:lipoprotein-anchoring transpeptidase ErfK/SrfK
VPKAALALLFVLGFGAAGGVSAGVVASTTGTTGTTATTTTPTTTTTATRPRTIAPGVTIAGVEVGGLTADEARAAVTGSFQRPLLLLAMRSRLSVTPARLGSTAAVRESVARALVAAAGTAVKLHVTLSRPATARYLALVARRFDRKPVDARLTLRGLQPFIARQRPGWALRRDRSMAGIFADLATNSRAPVRLHFREVRPRVTRRSIGPVIVIRRGSNRLYLYDGMRLRRVFGVATGQSSYPTPLGRWTIVVKWRNPWWYPPSSSWARGQSPIPPGPGNPLGTRWMGLSASGVGIHGTPNDASIGYSASHGCVRMHIPDAEWLFNHVYIGTTVFIVSA